MKQIATAAVIFLLLSGCSKAPVMIEVWQEADEAIALLDEHATDISDVVGVLVTPGEAYWYEFDDGTCVQLWVLAEEYGIRRVRGITLGEPSKGYIDKSAWADQEKKTTDRLVLDY